jgi:hypothetical protein
MTVLLSLLGAQNDYSRALRDATPLIVGVVALIAVALFVVGATYRRMTRAHTAQPGLGQPRRGTSALLLGAIAAVLLVLVSASQHRIASLTIVRRASAARTMTPVTAAPSRVVLHRHARPPRQARTGRRSRSSHPAQRMIPVCPSE